MTPNLAMIAQMPKEDLSLIREADFEDAILAYAKERGWVACHFRPGHQRAGRWLTPIKGDRGFPDIPLARNGEVMCIEVKSETGRVTPEQQRWLDALGEYGWLWRPRHAALILEVLK